MHDPESLISGAESAAGMTYTNSHREYPSESVYFDAVHGRIDCDEIIRIAPRVRNFSHYEIERAFGLVYGDLDYGR